MEKIILLADMESFYASVETAEKPSLRGKPVVVCGDPRRRHGIVLAASKEAKAFGVKTGMALWECRNLCPQAVLIQPHMKKYVDMSLRITEIFQAFTDRVAPYSIDEQFLDMTGCERLFGTPWEMALKINQEVWEKTRVRCRIGIGENPLQAKMACDIYAKKSSRGIFLLTHDNYGHYIWPLPVRKLFGVGNRMEKNLVRMGVRKIGHLANLPKKILKNRWGVNGEVLWLNSHGIDYSNVLAMAEEEQKGVGHSMTLPRDYTQREEIEVVLLEITEEVCRRARSMGKMGKAVSLYCRGADFKNPAGFSRQKKLPKPSALTMEVYPLVLRLFDTHWDRKPLRAVGISLFQLLNDRFLQLSLLEDREKKVKLTRAVDNIRNSYGATSLFRASSLTRGGQLFAWSKEIGGHKA